jgi:hypothetical protein
MKIMDMKYKSALIASFVILFYLPGKVIGQDTTKTFHEDIEIVKAYKPKLSDAIKINVTPLNERIEYQKPTFTYDSKPQLLEIKPVITAKLPAVSTIKSKAIPKKTELSRFFVKLGVGNYSNILADLNYNSTKLKDGLIAASFKHHSGDCDVLNSQASEQIVDLSGRKFFGSKTLDGKLYFDNNIIRFYNYNHDSFDLSKDQVKQNFVDYGIKASFNNELDTSGKLKYWIDADFYKITDNFSAGETGVEFKTALEQNLIHFPFKVALAYKYFNYGIEEKSTRNILNVDADYVIHKPKYKVEVGFKIAYEGDSAESKAHFYPNIFVQGSLVGSQMIGFAGMTGNLIDNTFRSYAKENPFILSDLEIKSTNNKYEIFGGFKGSFNNKFNYQARLSYHNYEYLYMFVNDSSSKSVDSVNRFMVIYDSTTTTLLKFHAEASTFISDNFELFAEFNYYKYEMANEKYPWHRPTYDIKLTGKYNLQKKIYFNLDVFVIGERKAKLWEPNPPESNYLTLDPIYDLNLGLTYKFSKMFAVFFQFNNILSTKYSYWNGYPLRGFHLIGGLNVNL